MTASSVSKARLLARISLPAALFVMLGGCPPETAPVANSNEKIGFPTTAAAVTVDGVATEAAWNSSFKFLLEDGAHTQGAFMRGMADAGHVYFYFEAEDTAFDNFDAVVLAFNPTNAAGDYKRLHIYPCQLIGGGVCPGMGSSSGLDPTVESGTGTLAGSSVTWGALTTGAPPAGVQIKSAAAPNGMANRWGVEISIPRNATYNFPATNFFGLFTDVVSTDVGNGEAAQYTWPLGTFIGANADDAFGTIQGAPLPLARWGNGSLDPAQAPSGIQVTGLSNVGLDPTAISRTQPNEFWGTVANFPPGSAGAVTGSAQFKINNIGLNPSWTWTVVPPGAAADGPKTINLNEYMPFTSGEWALSTSDNWQGSGQSSHDFFTTHDHQCIMVEFTPTVGSVVSRYFNMTFVEVNSPFEINPQIATGAWRKNFETARGVTLREFFLNGGADFKWQSMFEGAEPGGEHRWVMPKLEGDSQTLRTSILAGDSLRLPSQRYDLDPVAMSQGKPVDIRVKPGSVLTLLADGEAKIGERTVSAAGLGPQAAKRAQIDVRPMPDSLRNGSTLRAGALLGSFDGFRTAFEIGSGATIFVPLNADRLQVGFAEGVPFSGGRYQLSAIATEPNAIALDGRSMEAMRGAKGPVLLALGSNLPMHIVRGFLDTGQVITIHGKHFRATVPMGSYGAYIRSVRGQVTGGGLQVQPTGTNLTAAPLTTSTAVRVKPKQQ